MAFQLLTAAWRVNRSLPVLVLVLLAINIAVYVWITAALSPRVNDLERQLIQSQDQVRQSAQQVEQSRSPQRRYEKAQADLQAFRQAIPERSEFTGLLQELFSLAETAGLGIDSVTYQPTQLEGEGLLQYGLNFSVNGEYGQIKRFVHALEQSSRVIAIDEIALNGESGQDGPGVKLNIRLSTFFRLERP